MEDNYSVNVVRILYQLLLTQSQMETMENSFLSLDVFDKKLQQTCTECPVLDCVFQKLVTNLGVEYELRII